MADGNGSRALTEVVGALKGSPVLLLIVILNAAFIGASGYYLTKLEEYRHEDRERVLNLLDRCLAGGPAWPADHRERN